MNSPSDIAMHKLASPMPVQTAMESVDFANKPKTNIMSAATALSATKKAVTTRKAATERKGDRVARGSEKSNGQGGL